MLNFSIFVPKSVSYSFIMQFMRRFAPISAVSCSRFHCQEQHNCVVIMTHVDDRKSFITESLLRNVSWDKFFNVKVTYITYTNKRTRLTTRRISTKHGYKTTLVIRLVGEHRKQQAATCTLHAPHAPLFSTLDIFVHVYLHSGRSPCHLTLNVVCPCQYCLLSPSNAAYVNTL